MLLSADTRLGHYEIISALSAGGMGEVYVADDTRLHRRVALKILPETSLADPERLERFEREAQAIAALSQLPTQPLTGEGRIVGTVAYMSPEQAEGRAVDERSDLFSLGIILSEMATGERPFKGDTNLSVLSSIIKDTPRLISDINRSLPREMGRTTGLTAQHRQLVAQHDDFQFLELA